MSVAVMEKVARESAKSAKAKSKLASEGCGQIEVMAGALHKVMARLDAVVEKRNTIPLLSCVRMAVRDGQLHLTGTDLDIVATDFVEASCGRKDISPFATCVSSHKLMQISKTLPAEATVRLRLDGNRLHLLAETECGPVEYRLLAYDADEFPTFPIIDPVAEFEMPAPVLAAAIKAVNHAISKEDTRYYLNGIFMHVPEKGDLAGKLCFVATDGHRLARWHGAVPDGAQALPPSIVHSKTIKQISSLIEGLDVKNADDVEVSVAVSVNKIAVTIGTCDLVCKLIDGMYPDYTRVVPTGNDKRVTLRPAHLSRAVKQLRIIASEKTRALKLDFTGDGACHLMIHSPDNGDANGEIRCEYLGERLQIGFNSQYMLDIMAMMGGDSCTLTMADSSAPVAISNYEGASADYVLMPMRV